MKKLMIFSAMAATGLAAPAMAQDATDHAGHAMDAETAEAPATAPQTAAPMAEGEAMAAPPVTEAEVDSFAAAIVDIQKIEGDAAIPAEEKQAQMVATVSEHGLTPQRFNEISTRTQTDTELQQRIQVAMTELMSPAG